MNGDLIAHPLRERMVTEAALAIGRTRAPFAWGNLNDQAQAECIDMAIAAVEALLSSETLQTEVVEHFRSALMVEHADDWDMETVSEAAHVCARALTA